MDENCICDTGAFNVTRHELDVEELGGILACCVETPKIQAPCLP